MSKSAPLTKILMSFWILMRISWDSHEKMKFSWEFSNSHENLSRGFLLMRISFFSWELKAHKNLVRFSWDSHEKMTFSWDFLMSFFTGENLIFLTSVESSWESHEILMRVSWDSHEKTLSRKLCFCFFSWLYRVIPSIRKFFLRMWFHEFSRSHAKVNIRCMHVVLVKENHFKVLSSSKLNMFTWVETRLCVLVYVRVLVTWQRTNSVTIDRVTAATDDGVDAETSLSLSLHLYLSSPPLHFILALTFGQ